MFIFLFLFVFFLNADAACSVHATIYYTVLPLYPLYTRQTVAKEGEANESPNVIVEENAHERRLMMALCLPPPLHLVSTFTTFHSAEVDGTIGAAAMGTHTHTHREKKRKYKISN